MKSYEVGYGRPPKHSQFKKGECPNPRGRGKRKPSKTSDVIHKVLSEEVEYREGRRIGRASKRELIIRKLFSEAMRGDVGSADALLKQRMHAENHGEAGPLMIRIINDPEQNYEYDDH